MCPRAIYATVNSVSEGVGYSQVYSYLKKLTLDYEIVLVSYEKEFQTRNVCERIKDIGVSWIPMRYGKQGNFHGLVRIIRMARTLRTIDCEFVHARGDYAFIAALIANKQKIIWDCRALNADQTIEILGKSKFSFGYIFLRILEYMCARFSVKVIAITENAKDFLCNRYKIDNQKISVVSTCVDLDKFHPRAAAEPVPNVPVKILIPGTLGRQYDYELMEKIIFSLAQEVNVQTTLALGPQSRLEYNFNNIDQVVRIPPEEMSKFILGFDLGLSVWKNNLGTSLLSVAATKNAEFLASGIPIVVNSRQGDIGKLVENYRAGVSTDKRDNASIEMYKNRIRALLKDPDTSNRCRRLAEDHYSLEIGVSVISGLYRELSLV